MGLHWNSRSPSANVPGAEPADTQALLGARRAVALDLRDTALEQMLRGQLGDRRDLYEADIEDADVVIVDHQPAIGTTGVAPLLRVGADELRRNAIDSLDPGLILSAATLIAAGYALEREAAGAVPFRLSESLLPHLSARERQVAELLVDGASNKVIARALDISVHTAKFHVTAILDKLGARNRADAVSIILREGLVAL